jgi:hypothetical protein
MKRRKLSSLIAVVLGLFALVAETGCAPEKAPAGGSGEVAIEDLNSEEMAIRVAEMLQVTDTLDRVRQTVALMDALNEDNLPGAIEAYQKDLNRVQPHESRLFANAWARIDPKGALDRMQETWTYPKIAFPAVEEAAYVWALSDDAAGARAYVDPSMGSVVEKGRAPTNFLVLAVLKALAVGGELEELTGLLEGLKDSPNRDMFLTDILIELNRGQGMRVMRDWINSMSWEADNELKYSALRRGLDWSSQMNGEFAASWYEEVESDSDSDAHAHKVMPMAVVNWSVRDPGPAMQWLGKRPPSETRDQLIRTVAVGWLTRRPELAEPWILEQLDDELMRDRLILPLANLYLSARKYEQALEWCQQIPRDYERNISLSVVLSEWTRLDEGAAAAYITEHKVSDSVVAGMRKRLGGPVNVQRRQATTDSESGDQGG